jgi:hypothetical protein
MVDQVVEVIQELVQVHLLEEQVIHLLLVLLKVILVEVDNNKVV